MKDTLPIEVLTEDGAKRSGLTGAELHALVDGIGGDRDRFVVVERVPASPEVYVQTWREGTGPYGVEFRDGSADRHFHVEIDGSEVVAKLLVDWALGNERWRTGHDWQRLSLDAPELSAETQAEAERFVRELVHGGFTAREQVVVHLTEHFGPEDEQVGLAQARTIVDRLWQERLTEQAGWPRTTDADRLLAVFRTLAARGIVARPDFTCCGNCGTSEIGAEAGEGARGFVFFHSQDTARAAAGGGMWLAYGSLPGSPDDSLAVGREVAAALTADGLPVVWNDSADTRIHVTPLDWKKRIPQDGSEPAQGG